MAILAIVLLLLAQDPDFEPLYRQAYEERKAKLGETHPRTEESARNLALYLVTRERISAAEPYLAQALRRSTSLEEATALHNWAVALEPAAPDNAEKLYRKALAIRERGLAPLDVELATTRLNLAGLRLGTAPGEASRLSRLALVAFEKSAGPKASLTGSACGTLGAALAILGDAAGAERQFRRALSIAEAANGAQSMETANALDNLADLLEQTGRSDAAAPLRQRAERIRARPR